MLEGLLLKDARPVCAGTKGKTNVLSCICVNPRMLPMDDFLRLWLYTLKKSQTWEGEL